MSMKRKKVGHEQGLSVQLSIVGHFFPRRPPPPQTKLSRHISANNVCLLRKIIFKKEKTMQVMHEGMKDVCGIFKNAVSI